MFDDGFLEIAPAKSECQSLFFHHFRIHFRWHMAHHTRLYWKYALREHESFDNVFGTDKQTGIQREKRF